MTAGIASFFMRLLIGILFSLSLLTKAQAQFGPLDWGPMDSLKYGMFVSVDSYYGKLFKHRPDKMLFDLPNPLSGFSVEVSKLSSGRRYWHHVYGFPRVGWAFFVQNFGNAEVLGRAYGLFPVLDFDLLQARKLELFFRFGFTYAFVDRPFDREDNPENTAIGSIVNNLTMIALLGEYRFHEHWALRLGGQFTHISNARLRQPNLGLNSAKLRLGLVRHIHPLPKRSPYTVENHPLDKTIRLQLRLSLAFAELKSSNGPFFPIYTIALGLTKNLNRKSKLQAGFLILWDELNRSFIRDNGIEDPGLSFLYRRPALYLGHELMFGRASLMTMSFLYLDHPFVGRRFWGLYIGPKLYLWGRPESGRFQPFIGMYLKAHGFVADYADIVLGISF